MSSADQLCQETLVDGTATIALLAAQAPLSLDVIDYGRLSAIVALGFLMLQKTLAACACEVGARHWSPPPK